MRRSRRAWGRPGTWGVGILIATTTVPAWPPARADDARVAVRAEIGAEYDSNVHRAEQIAQAVSPPVVGSAVGRAVFGWSAADRVADGQDVAFSLLGAGKAFAARDARNENVAVVESAGSWRLAIDARTRVGLGATYYEAIQAGTDAERVVAERTLAGDPRDFRSLTGNARLQRTVGDDGSLSLAAGARSFVYKPNRDYDFTAPVASLEYRLTRETSDRAADWDAVVGAGVELRRFAGPRLVPVDATCVPTDCPTMPDPSGARHDDQFYSARIDVMRTGRVLVGAGYALQWNRSNSTGEAVLFHVGAIRFTAPLPAGIYLAARAELAFASYAVPLTLAVGPTGRPSATIDDENRSQLRVELSRDIGDRLQLVGRYSLYVNALNQGAYHRQTATLSIAFAID